MVSPEFPGIRSVPGIRTQNSYYELCIQAGEFYKLAETARSQGDTSAWAAAHMMAAEGSKASAAPAAVAPPEPS